MRPASPAPDRHRQDTDPTAQNQDEGHHPHRHDYDCDYDYNHDQHHETELDHYLAVAVVDAPMIDAPVATATTTTTTAIASTAATDIHTPALAASSSLDIDDTTETSDPKEDNQLPENTNLDSNPPAQLSARQTVSVDEYLGIAQHHEQDPEPELSHQDYDLEMSDSDGGAPLDEEQTPTELPEPEPLPQIQPQPIVLPPQPLPLQLLPDNVSIPSFQHLGFHYYIGSYTVPGGHNITINNNNLLMNDPQQTGTWVPVPAMPAGQPIIVPPGQLGQPQGPAFFEPVLDDPVLISNPNPTMLGSENLGFVDFLRSWSQMSRFQSSYVNSRDGFPYIEGIRKLVTDQTDVVVYDDLKGDACDMQGVDWTAMGLTREQARNKRKLTYKNYVNKQGSDQWARHMGDYMIRNSESYFRFKKMHLRQDVHLAHFQLRSVLACPASNQAFYSASRGINRINPVSRKTELALSMDEFTGLGAMISTLDANHGLLMAGTFNGEYCLKNLESEDKKNFSDGQITSDPNGITNHLQINSSRRSGGPVAAISSNDMGFRLMDLTTEKIFSETRYPFAMNCTALSPDRRLRVMVGDSCSVLIVDSDTGQIQQRLSGHRDYGFACDWSDDGWTVATGNQDKGVKIWDARYWCNSSGESRPICTIRSEMAGVRGLRFSPEGSGRKVLVAAEEADLINIIDAETFSSRQVIDIFGEIGGIAFTNDGQDLNVLCTDRHRGGLLQLERCGGGPEPFYGNSCRRKLEYWGWHNEIDDSLHMDESYRRRPTKLDSLPIF